MTKFDAGYILLKTDSNIFAKENIPFSYWDSVLKYSAVDSISFSSQSKIDCINTEAKRFQLLIEASEDGDTRDSFVMVQVTDSISVEIGGTRLLGEIFDANTDETFSLCDQICSLNLISGTTLQIYYLGADGIRNLVLDFHFV